ncbi:energy transducer TonB [Thiocystis violacea]|uniref:energy transducer TonB n=1 Tax=Thiocystis violacea TaxID=13725 RepID=UPI0019048CDC|nr:energy transducer TonB [Thiocystis violacea]MBK1720752.1 hypothetical protein [Thiocystis violacea]
MRLLASVLVAGLVTLALFYLMQRMIAGETRPPETVVTLAAVRLVEVEPAAVPADAEPSDAAGSQPAPEGATPPPAPPPAPPLALADPPPPVSDLPLEASLPELAPIEPGGKPYLGEPVKPVAKRAPTPDRKTAAAAERKQRPTKARAAKERAPPVAKKRAAAAPKAPARSSRSTAAAKSDRARSAAADAGKGAESGSGAGKRGSGSSRSSAGSGSGRAGASAQAGRGGGTREAVAISKPRPDYPREAARAGQEGWVKLEFTITTQGRVESPRVLSSRPRKVFDRAALKAIRQWRFTPKTVDGRPVSRRATQVIEFSLANR